MDTRIARTLQQVEEQLHTGMGVRDLAAEVGLSVSRFSRLFHEALGVSPRAYLRERRMLRARILIERSSLTVREVMIQVGISDPSHFARDFRNAHGFSPRTLRQQLRITGLRGRYDTVAPAVDAQR